jgi:hypothetical protein
MDVANMKYTYKDKNNVTVAKNLYKEEVNPKIIGSNPNDLVIGEDYHAWVL